MQPSTTGVLLSRPELVRMQVFYATKDGISGIPFYLNPVGFPTAPLIGFYTEHWTLSQVRAVHV